MGYFLRKFGLVTEAETDGEDQGGAETTDYSEEENNAATDDAATETNTEAGDGGEANEQGADDSGDNNTDYNDLDADTPDDMGEEGGQEGGDGGSEGDSSEGGSTGGDGEEQPVDELKKQEEDIYSSANLTPDQLDIKHKELKQNFFDMYDMISNIIDRIGDASISEENIKVVEYVSEQLTKLRTMISDYVNHVYSGKSYIENAINFNRFLAVLQGINKLLEELDKQANK